MCTYLLADDLSGALEAGAAFRARGTAVTLTLDTLNDPAPGGLLLFSSETRNAEPAVAAAMVARLLIAENAAGGHLLLKKIDSTLRGPVGAEIQAVIEVLTPPLVVVCPANPAVGRTVREGRLLVHGVPVAETEFRNDPRWPVKESSVAAVLAAGGVGNIKQLSLDRLRSLDALDAADARGVLVSDAESTEDLARLVRLVRQREPRAVFVGSGGIAHALAAGIEGQGSVDWKVPGSVLIVSGSMSSQSRRQLEFLRSRYAVALHEIDSSPGGEERVVAQLARSLAERGAASLTVAKNFSSTDLTEPVKRLTAVIATLAASGIEPELLAATGGETARALCAALGVSRLELVCEIEPGVVIARIQGGGSRKLTGMVIKPGGFGSDEIWADIIPHGVRKSMK